MRQIQIADHVYDQVKRRADAAGFESVDQYISDMLADDDLEFTPDLEHLFTPERLAIIDQSLTEVRAGAKTYTIEEVSERLAHNRADRIRKSGK
jgi:hypothetical protein